ncbi:hypothetical protein [Pseudomonas oligotrophica]|uniref:hypothetical protein n=1 Tax=Pseudomonas oligotrophica TaxID=2912055 RepID=UPI001F1BE29A|nr:hypothetical protein [Pseudomonas oligotrophica]MCF7202836.1 hypothetical protein [Pseudomonas oligotrophica]
MASEKASDPIIPGSPELPGRGRTDLNPSDEAGIDELPGNEGNLPRERGDDTRLPDTDPDNAEREGTPGPR